MSCFLLTHGVNERKILQGRSLPYLAKKNFVTRMLTRNLLAVVIIDGSVYSRVRLGIS